MCQIECFLFLYLDRLLFVCFPKGCKIKSGSFSNFSCPIVEVITFVVHWYKIRTQLPSSYEKRSNKRMKILKFWRTELSSKIENAQNKKRGEEIRLLDSNKEKEMK